MTFDVFLKEACPPLGLNWRKYRRRSARRGVLSRMRGLGLTDFASYLRLVREDASEAAGLPDLMRVTVSRFFRERDMWEALKEAALPPVLDEKRPGNVLRVWSAGCCGGEEPYTFAILWLGGLADKYPGVGLRVLATDIDEAALARAAAGVYAGGSLKEVPSGEKDRRFTPEGGLWRVGGEVMRLVRFVRHKLLSDPPPDGMDVVLCRYLAFTYYRGERLLEAAGRIHKALAPGGLLMTGRKESLPGPALGLFRPLPGLRGFYGKAKPAV